MVAFSAVWSATGQRNAFSRCLYGIGEHRTEHPLSVRCLLGAVCPLYVAHMVRIFPLAVWDRGTPSPVSARVRGYNNNNNNTEAIH